MIRGYVRVSTKKQAAGTSLEDQRAALRAEGCEALYEDVSTGGSMDRPELDRLCREVRPGDTIAVTKMDRFARTETEAYERVVGWVRSGVRVRVLNMGVIEDTELGRLILHIMLSFAEFERDMIISPEAGRCPQLPGGAHAEIHPGPVGPRVGAAEQPLLYSGGGADRHQPLYRDPGGPAAGAAKV